MKKTIFIVVLTAVAIVLFNCGNNTTFYIPEVNNNPNDDDYYYCNDMLTDRFYKYICNGKSFVMQNNKTYADVFLHPKLSDYKRIVHLLSTKSNKVRIDLMHDETYRYAAWKAYQDILEKPELIISDGSYYGGVYVFQNEGYIYHVDDDGIKVTKPGKIVGEWERC